MSFRIFNQSIVSRESWTHQPKGEIRLPICFDAASQVLNVEIKPESAHCSNIS
ncbi:MAG TPA: hypothetical protein PL126_01450 [Candidatus Cloacimonadota bacterium]|nr:hypothetical protein [Candidatus Cloacimonadota bacterium]